MFLFDNFSETHLLFSEPVECVLYANEQKTILLATFVVKLPTVRELYFNNNVAALLSLLKFTIPELQSKFKLTQDINSHLEFINFLFSLKDKVENLQSLLYNILNGLQFLCPDCTIQENKLYIKNREIDDKIFERLRDIWLTSIDVRTFSNNYKYMSPEERALEEKIQAIKNQRKNNKGSSSFEQFYIILTYEFGYSRDDILNMTMYAVKTILKYTSKSINYKLTLLAKANGNAKKVKFITDKGDSNG